MRKLIILALILWFLTPTSILAEKAVKVAVTPFSIYSKEDLSYLSAGLQEMLGSRLVDQGLAVVSQADAARVLKEIKIPRIDETTAREIGRALGVDYVIYGSLTKVGQRVSLDVRIVDISGVKKTSAVFIQSTGLEELAEDAGKLAREITARVAGRQKIAEINISGNKRIEIDALRQVLQSKIGDIFSADVVSDDLKRIYAMGFFEDVKVDVEDSTEGKIIRFILEERPSIQSIEFSGNRMLETEDLMAALGYKTFSILNPKKLADSLQQVKDLYREKGYYNSEIDYKVDPLGPDTVAVRYKVTEGRRVYIKKIEFLGNKAFTGGKLRGEMKTSQKGFFFWFTDSGILKKEALKADVDKLVSYYHDNGY
ncbi:MAG: POTRA domain-containing protein, partial [Pseudomonadota bacterium]